MKHVFSKENENRFKKAIEHCKLTILAIDNRLSPLISENREYIKDRTKINLQHDCYWTNDSTDELSVNKFFLLPERELKKHLIEIAEAKRKEMDDIFDEVKEKSPPLRKKATPPPKFEDWFEEPEHLTKILDKIAAAGHLVPGSNVWNGSPGLLTSVIKDLYKNRYYITGLKPRAEDIVRVAKEFFSAPISPSTARNRHAQDTKAFIPLAKDLK